MGTAGALTRPSSEVHRRYICHIEYTLGICALTIKYPARGSLGAAWAGRYDVTRVLPPRLLPAKMADPGMPEPSDRPLDPGERHDAVARAVTWPTHRDRPRTGGQGRAVAVTGSGA
jgi:hypothetical protein